jgi:adenosylhomocysteine nucleosidase
MKILILSALPQEYAPLQKHFPALRSVRKGLPRKFVLNLPDKAIILIESGMGDRAVREALGGEASVVAPDLIIFSGFAGGLHPGLSVGSVCFAATTRHIEAETTYGIKFPEELGKFLAERRILPVLALSAKAPGNKHALSAHAFGYPAVLDMETATVAKEALSRHIPFICFRAISDGVDHDLGFNLEDISDEQGRVRPLRVLTTIVKKPSTVRSFYLLWRNSRLAAKNLCAALAAFVNLPASELATLLSEIRVERRGDGGEGMV